MNRKLLHDAWKRFDRCTAYACAQRGHPYDDEACRAAWEAYASKFDAAPQTPFATDLQLG